MNELPTPPTAPPAPHSDKWNAARKEGYQSLRRTLEATKHRQEQFREEQERKRLQSLEQKKEEVRKETRALIAAASGPTLACPDCKEVKQRGGGLVVHRTTYCKLKKF